MRTEPIQGKKTTEAFKGGLGPIPTDDALRQMLLEGKRATDQTVMKVGRIFVELIPSIKQEKRIGADYHPIHENTKRNEAALEQTSYQDVASMLKKLDLWFSTRNESAASSERGVA